MTATLRVGDQICAYSRDSSGWNWMRTGPYRITEITTGCTCSHIVAMINHGRAAQARPEHIHIVAEGWENDGYRRNPFYLNGYDPDTLQDVLYGPEDFLVVGERGPEPQVKLQMELFEAEEL